MVAPENGPGKEGCNDTFGLVELPVLGAGASLKPLFMPPLVAVAPP